MKKQLLVLSIISLFLFSIMAVSADTKILGSVFNSEDREYATGVPNATVDITCNGITNTVYTASNGFYKLDLTSAECGVGSAIKVCASKDGLSKCTDNNDKVAEGSQILLDFDLGLIDRIVLVPEFGLFVGTLTILSAIGIFFFVRRN